MTKIDKIRRAWKTRAKIRASAERVFQKHWRALEKGNRLYDPGQDANNYQSQRYYDQAEILEHRADLMVKGADEQFMLACGEILEEPKPIKTWKPNKSERKKLKELDDFYVKMGL